MKLTPAHFHETRVDVRSWSNDKKIAFQQALFQLGFTWSDGQTIPLNVEDSAMYFLYKENMIRFIDNDSINSFATREYSYPIIPEELLDQLLIEYKISQAVVNRFLENMQLLKR